METQTQITFFESITNIIALHGAYALTAIFLFYQQRITRKNLEKANRENRTFYQRLHICTVSLSYLLVIVSVTVWIYATFIYERSPHLRGSATGLKSQFVEPKKLGDPPLHTHSITPRDTSDIRFYSRKNKQGVEWVAFFTETKKLGPVVLTFSQRYVRIKNVPGSSTLSLEPTAGRIQIEGHNFDENFRIDPEITPCALKPLMKIEYEAPNGARARGDLYCRKPDKTRIRIPWEDEEISQHSPLFRGLQIFRTAHAQVQQASQNPPPTTQSFPQTDLMRQIRLSDPALLKASLTEINDKNKIQLNLLKHALTDEELSTLSPYEFVAVVNNLGMVADDLIKNGHTPSNQILVKLAQAFYDISDYHRAAHFYEKVSVNERPLDTHFYLAYSYFSTKQYDQAMQNIERFKTQLKQSNKSSARRKAVLHNLLGMIYFQQGQHEKTIASFKEAIKIDSKYSIPLNNLAWYYVENLNESDKKQKLTQAMNLVNRALKIEEKPAFLDTKGWIYCQMGSPKEAKPLIERAISADPSNNTRKIHLKQIKDGHCGKSPPIIP